MLRKCTLLWQGAFLPMSSAAAPAFLAMALIWSSFTDAGTETVDIREGGGSAGSDTRADAAYGEGQIRGRACLR